MLIKLSGKNFQQAGLKFTYVIWCYAMNKLYHLRRCHSCSIGRHKWFVCCETELEQKKKKWEWHSCRKSPRSHFMPQWSRVKATWLRQNRTHVHSRRCFIIICCFLFCFCHRFAQTLLPDTLQVSIPAFAWPNSAPEHYHPSQCDTRHQWRQLTSKLFTSSDTYFSASIVTCTSSYNGHIEGTVLLWWTFAHS